MATILGLSCNVFANAGSFATPDWDPVEAIRNATLQVPQIMADASRRGSGGFKQYLATLKDASLELEMVKDKDDALFVDLYDAFVANTPIELAVVDGDNASGTYYLLAKWIPENWEETQELEGIVMINATYRIAPDADVIPAFGSGALPTTRI